MDNKLKLMMQAVNDLRGDLDNGEHTHSKWRHTHKILLIHGSTYDLRMVGGMNNGAVEICHIEEFGELVRELSEDWQPTLQSTLQPTNNDQVNKPVHYDFFPSIEASDIIRTTLNSGLTNDMTPYQIWCFGTKLKYHLRAGKKDDVFQELAKGDKYREMAGVDNA